MSESYQLCAHLAADGNQASVVIPDEHGTATHWCQWCAASQLSAMIEKQEPSAIASQMDFSQCGHNPTPGKGCRFCRTAFHSTLSAHWAHLKLLRDPVAARLERTLQAVNKLHGRVYIPGILSEQHEQAEDAAMSNRQQSPRRY